MSPSQERLAAPLPDLPLELTSFVGRDRELDQLDALLGSSRLVTLTGAGGSGKSRLALEAVLRAVRGASVEGKPGAVAWAELAVLEDPLHLLRHVADACGIGEEIPGGAGSGLASLLGDRRLLLVLDNCEHLVDACAELADALLRGCPDLRILATSREALGVPGERAWLVPPLSLPGEGPAEATAGARLPDSEAVRLFVERARDVVADFALTGENAPAVAEICRRLDGIPLAIELAAARVKTLSPAQIRDRLDDAFHLLTTGGRTTVARHRTLRATMEWSHDLLRGEARTALRRLAVFRGGFDLDAAEAVLGGDGIETGDVLDLVAHLVDRSLVDVREQHGRSRYVLLETVRQYAQERLAAAGEEEAVRARHARWVADLVAEAEPHLVRRERRRWVDRLLGELDNVREALSWSRRRDARLHVGLVGRLWWFWYSTRHWTEAGRWIQEALALPEAAGAHRDRGVLLFSWGALRALQARPGEARPALEEAERLAREVGDDRLAAYALNYLGMTWIGDGDPRGAELCRRAAAWFREHDDLYGLRLAYLLLGSSAGAAGDFESGERYNREGVAVARAFGQDRELAVSLMNLAAVYLNRGDPERSEPLLLESLAACRNDPSYFFMATALQYLGEVRGLRGRAREAARILGCAEALRERIGARPFRVDAVRLERAVAALRGMGEARFREVWAEGRRLPPEDLLDEVLAGEVGPGAGAADGPARDTPPTSAPPGATARSEGGGRSAAAVDLVVRALGPLEVEVEGRVLEPEAWSYTRPRDLLLLLLLHPGGRTRDEVGRLLWPGASAAQVKNSFHVTVHHLRKTLDHPEWIVREGERYRLAPGLRVDFDVARFEAEVEGLRRVAESEPPGPGGSAVADRLDRALALYRGDLLDGEAGGRWLEDEGDRLRRLRAEAVLARGRLLEARGDHAGAARLYHPLALREELDEEVHRRLMLAWARSGERARAIRHYETLVELLSEALDAQPEPATRELWEEIRSGAGAFRSTA